MSGRSDKSIISGLESVASPFELARKLHITINYYDFPNNIYGLYTPEDNSVNVLINENISLENQEKVCTHMIAHHLSYSSQAPALCIDSDMFSNLERRDGLFARLFKRRNMHLQEY